MAGKQDVKAGGAFVELFVKMAKFEAGLNLAAAKLKKFGESMTAIGTKLAAFGVAGGTGLGLAAKRFADFDDAMRAAGAAIGATDAEMASLSETAKRLGAETGAGALAAASMMVELGRAGFVAAEVDKMTGAVLDLARATGTDATLSAGIMSSTIRQFGLGATDASKVADVLTLAANKSFTSVEQLGEALSYAGPVAADFGMTLEDTAALLGGLGNVGIQGSEAGTALRRLLTLTGAEAEKLQGIFGVTFVDAAGNARPLLDTLEEVNNATKSMGSAERASKFNEAFGLLGITGASAIGKSVGSIKELRDALTSSAGAAADTAKKMEGGLGGSLRKVWTAAEGVALQVGEALAPALQKIGDVIVDLSSKIGVWIKNNQELVVVVAAVVAGIGALGFALVATGIAATTAAAALSGIAAIVAIISSPLTIVVATVTALGAAFIYSSGLATKLVDSLKPLLGSVKEITKALMEGDFKRAWDLAATSVKYFGSVALDIFTALPEYAAYAAGAVAKAIIEGFKIAWEWVKSMPSLIDAMLFGDGTIGEALDSAMKSAAAKMKSIGAAFAAGFAGEAMPGMSESDRTKALRMALGERVGGGLASMENSQQQGKGKGAITTADAKKLLATGKAATLGGKAAGEGDVFSTFSGAALIARTFAGGGIAKPEDKIVAAMKAELAESKKMVDILTKLLDKARDGKLVFG